MSFASNSELQKLMSKVVAIFCKYASKEGSNITLNKMEAKELLEKELLFNVEKEKQLDAFKAYMKILDSDQDSVVTFLEFMNMLTVLVIIKNSKMTGCHYPKPHELKK